MIRHKISSRIFSFVLLFGILLTIAPTTLFDHHEHHIKICTEQEKHFDTPEHDCSFCDFVVPAHFPTTSSFAIEAASFAIKAVYSYWENPSFFKNHSFLLRGPPSCFQIGN